MTRSSATRPLQCLAVVAALMLVGCGAKEPGKLPGAQAAAPGMSYESLGALPDWSGAWGATVRPTTPVTDLLLKEPSPLKPAALEQLRATRKATDAGIDPGLAREEYCRPFAYGGLNAGLEARIEFLFTPGRVTITSEGGLIRRIFTDGRKLPVDVEESNAGTSIGHWENQTLVVETVGLNPEADLFGVRTAPSIGRNARTTERIFLRGDGVLEVDTVLDAPDVLRQPLQFNMTYQRIGNLPMGEYSACPKYDRSIDPATGKQRFDLTPPSDLPPPPHP
jgi:hypothetical protein